MSSETQFMAFETWWTEIAQPRMNHFIDKYIEEFPEYTEEDTEDYTDSGCVHRLVHEGEVDNVLWDICQEVFQLGYEGTEWEMSMSDSLFCNLDDIISLSYNAGQKTGANV